MSRSNNSRKGKNKSRGHSKRHNCCGKNCSYCEHNFKIAEIKQKQSGLEEAPRLTGRLDQKYPTTHNED